MIEYKGYTGVFEFDPSIDALHGRVIGLQDVVTFEGRSVEELRHEMEASVEDYLELCAEARKEPERPYRGEFLVRTTPEVHRAVATAAEAEGVSLNAWVESTLAAVAHREGSVRRSRRKAPPYQEAQAAQESVQVGPEAHPIQQVVLLSNDFGFDLREQHAPRRL